MIESNNTKGYDKEMFEVLTRKIKRSGEDGIDAALAKYNLDALVAPHVALQLQSAASCEKDHSQEFD